MAGGPEAIYAAMVSGDPGAVQDAIADCRKAMDDLTDSIDLIRFAEDRPDWNSPSARTQFNMRAWATKASAEVSFIRVNRTSLTLQKVLADYQGMVQAASEVITAWRDYKKQPLSGFFILLARAITIARLEGLKKDFGAELDEAIDFLVADPLTSEQEEWLRNSAIRSMRRDLENPSGPHGPIIPNTLATGDDDGWTPQGLGYDPATQTLLQTSYHGDQAQLAVVDPETGEQLGYVDLAGVGGANGPDHAGGVSVHDGTVFVSSSDKPPRLFAYSLDDIRNAAPGATVQPQGDPQTMQAGAYSTVVGGTMYVGTFEEDGPGELYTYSYDSVRGEWVERSGPHPTPPQTQGVTVRGDDIVFSTSFGRNNASNLQSYDLDSILGQNGGSPPAPNGTVELPNMAEGVVALPDGVYTTFESGAATYSVPKGADLDALWASMNMSVTPYSDLGMDGAPVDVEPLTLTQASSYFDQAEAGLSSAKGTIDGVSLPTGALGSTPAGATYATTLTEHCDETAQWLAQGRLSASVTATGLVAAANAYDEGDNVVEQLFGMLSKLAVA